MMEKQEADSQFALGQHAKQWYTVNPDLLTSDLRSSFVQFAYDDAGTQRFLKNSRELSDSVFLQLYYNMAIAMLKLFLSKTSINGLLNRGSMFLFSREQFEILRGGASCPLMGCGMSAPRKGVLLDLGAGDGAITEIMAPDFDQVHVTELSSTMRWRLASRGFTVLENSNAWTSNGVKYRMVSALNLLDRHETPLKLLQNIKSILGRSGPDARFLLGIVLPFHQYVEFYSNVSGRHHMALEKFDVPGNCFEDSLASLASILDAQGFVIERWSKLPYLCQGDLYKSHYKLDNAVILLKLKGY